MKNEDGTRDQSVCSHYPSPNKMGTRCLLARPTNHRTACAQAKLALHSLGLIGGTRVIQLRKWVITQEVPFTPCKICRLDHQIPKLNPSTSNASGRQRTCVYSLRINTHAAPVFPARLRSRVNRIISSSSYGLSGGGTSVHLHNLCEQPRYHLLLHLHICPAFAFSTASGLFPLPPPPHSALRSALILYPESSLAPIASGPAPRSRAHRNLPKMYIRSLPT